MRAPKRAVFTYLELARIGLLLFIFADSLSYQNGFPSAIDTFVTRLSAQPLRCRSGMCPVTCPVRHKVALRPHSPYSSTSTRHRNINEMDIFFVERIFNNLLHKVTSPQGLQETGSEIDDFEVLDQLGPMVFCPGSG